MIYFQQRPTKLEIGYILRVLALSHLEHTGAQVMWMMGDEASSYLWKHGPPSGSQVAWACENVRQPNDNRK
jgi:hypothetical protein